MVNESKIRHIIKALIDCNFVPLKLGIIDNVNMVICLCVYKLNASFTILLASVIVSFSSQ
jgi:hypothetical protein